MKNKLISIVTPCFNEEENVEELSLRIREAMESQPYLYEHIFIDNASSDSTVEKIKQLIESDKRVRLIVNSRNFGHLKSPYYAILQSHGDAVILIASDLQDPPELIPELLKKWEMGFKTVMIVKKQSMENKAMFLVRKLYYEIMDYISETPVVSNAHGSGLFDRVVVNQLKKINDSYPYLRGLLSELGYPIGIVEFNQPRRLRGITKNNFYSLFDTAMLGITNHSKLPLRIMTIGGFLSSIFFAFCGLIYLVLKLIYWDQFSAGTAPIIIGLFFFSSVQLFFLGFLGEYVGSIHTQVRNLPLVVEAERVNFDD
jgi:glycosyltransferase involved in cell wall biosynthesis